MRIFDPSLSDATFTLQRKALESPENTLKILANGEMLNKMLEDMNAFEKANFLKDLAVADHQIALGKELTDKNFEVAKIILTDLSDILILREDIEVIPEAFHDEKIAGKKSKLSAQSANLQILQEIQDKYKATPYKDEIAKFCHDLKVRAAPTPKPSS